MFGLLSSLSLVLLMSENLSVKISPVPPYVYTHFILLGWPLVVYRIWNVLKTTVLVGSKIMKLLHLSLSLWHAFPYFSTT